MNSIRGGWRVGAWLVLGVLMPASASARAFSVDLWTDRGSDAVYRPGETIGIGARASEDAYLLVYEIDAEGNVHLLFPNRRSNGFVEGRREYRLPDDPDQAELVVQGPVGQGYIVAIASLDRFEDLPWYLRPYDPQAESMGYHGGPGEDAEEGITTEGRIVGDPFVAMERIRRRVLPDPEQQESFATAYVDYYVHTQVRYPRYLCNDCHRPGQWQWWDGFDPYYSRCSVFETRVNWSWGWGPSYWFGAVPYYVFVYRNDGPPRYRRAAGGGACFSSWDGWRRWKGMWGSDLVRYKSPPPPGYEPPPGFGDVRRRKRDGPSPPGFAAAGQVKRATGIQPMPIGRGYEEPRDRERGERGPSGREVRRMPIGRGYEEPRDRERGERGPSGREVRRMPIGRGYEEPRDRERGERGPSGREVRRMPTGRGYEEPRGRERGERGPSGREVRRMPIGRGYEEPRDPGGERKWREVRPRVDLPRGDGPIEPSYRPERRSGGGSGARPAPTPAWGRRTRDAEGSRNGETPHVERSSRPSKPDRPYFDGGQRGSRGKHGGR